MASKYDLTKRQIAWRLKNEISRLERKNVCNESKNPIDSREISSPLEVV